MVVLIIMLAEGCTKNSFQTDYQESTESGEIIIKWMVYGKKYKESDIVFNEFNRQLKRYFPDTTVEFEVVEKEYYKDKWDMKMATNETLDLAWIGNELFNYTEEVKKGSFMALNYLLSTYGEALIQNIPDKLWDLEVCDGNVFAIPIEGAIYRKSLGVVTKKYYMDQYGDKEMIRQVNFSSPYTTKECYQSLEGYLEYAKKFESIGSGVSYKSFSAIADKGLEGIYGVDSPFVIKIFDKKPKVYNKYKLDIYRDYFKTMAKWYQKGYIRADIADVVNPSSEDGKEKGSILFMDEYDEHGKETDMIHTEYDAVYIPLEDYKYISYDSCRNSIVIPKSSENPQRALEIMNLLVSNEGKDLYRLLVNGLEDEHYIVLDDHTIARRRNNDDELLYGLSQYTVGDTFQNYQLSTNEFNKIQENNEKAIVSKLSGFNLDTRMIVIELTKIDLIIEEYKDILSQGSSADWESLYKEFIQKMDEAGSDKIVAEMQRQIDEFYPIA